MKRIGIITILTIILLSLILYNKNEYLGIYKEYITIFFDFKKEDGYSWSYTLDNYYALKLHSYDENKTLWKFKAINNGEVQLIFEYKNEKETKYKIIYNLEVKNKKIYWTKGEGYGLTYYPDPK